MTSANNITIRKAKKDRRTFKLLCMRYTYENNEKA